MEKALKMGKASATGGFQLFVGTVLSSLILAVGSIFLGNFLSPSDYGLYSLALVPSIMISLFQDWGINSALTKYIANLRVTEKNEDIQHIISAGIVFKILTGLGLSLLSMFVTDFIATSIYHRPEITPLIYIVSVTIFLNSILTTAQSIFVGFERMEFRSLTTVCQAIIKCILSPLLVVLGFGIFGAVLGYIVSFLVASVIGLVVIYFKLFRNLKKTKNNRPKLFKTLKDMLRYGVPISISTIIGGFLLQFYNLMMAFYCNDVIIGNFRIALNFTVIPTFFTIPITTVLFPAFAKLDSQKENQLVKKVFTSSVKYTTMLLVPSTMALMVLSSPLVNTLFHGQYAYAPSFLTLYIINNLFSGFGSLSMSVLIMGTGETKTLMKLSLLTLITGLPLSFLLIPNLGVTGVVLVILLADKPSLFLGLHWIWKRYGVNADWASSTKIFLASSIATVTTYLFITFINTVIWLELISGGIIFLLAFIVVAPSVRAIVQDDLTTLRTLFSGLGFVLKLVNLPLVFMEKVIKLVFG